jgi:cellulose 1,4-beta-cellobiosidase
VNNGSSADTIAPLPNPAAFTEAPFPISSTAVSMVAVTATDAGGSNPVQYFFDEVSGNSGGTDSGWQISETFDDTGLSGKTQYGYRVKARDAAGNETDWSAIQLVTTPEQKGARIINASNMRTRMWK